MLFMLKKGQARQAIIFLRLVMIAIQERKCAFQKHDESTRSSFLWGYRLYTGRVYDEFEIAKTDSNYHYVHAMTKSGITYEAYPGERPVFDFKHVPTNLRVAVLLR